MSSASINFINHPRFSVDFKQFAAKGDAETEELTLNEKVNVIALSALQYSKVLFESFAQALCTTLSNSGAYFKYIVLGYYGSWSNFRPPASFPLAVFKIGFWVAELVLATLLTTKRLFTNKIGLDDHTAYLNRFCGDEINPAHMKIKEMNIDMSGVPETVKVDDLATIYKEINFTDKEKPGFVLPSSRREGTEDSLTTFINNVNNRTAFLGTPPATDASGLLRFYQQIEDGVRFSIHQSNLALADFDEKYKDNPNLQYFTDSTRPLPTDWDLETKSNYEKEKIKYFKERSDILEDRARIATDIAIAGKHCGSRYMGEVMEIYYTARGEVSGAGKTLQETVQELLAFERLKIAKGQILQHLGTDTHAYNKYMAHMGKILGLPGTENIVEHLDNQIDVNHYTKLFFQEYSVNRIIDAIQDKIKASQEFREKIQDWMKEHSTEWRKDECKQLSKEAMTRINEVLNKPNNNSDQELPELIHINHLIALVSHLKENKISLPEELGTDWKSGLQELFALDEAKAWAKENISEDNLKRSKSIRELKGVCSSDSLGELFPELQKAVLEGSSLDITPFKEKFSDLKKVEDVQKAIAREEDEEGNEIFEGVAIPTDVLMRALKNNTLEIVIRDQIALANQSEFLTELKLDETIEETIIQKGVQTTEQVARVVKEGFSKEMLEWLLDSHKVLFPQLQTFENVNKIESSEGKKVFVDAICANLEKLANKTNIGQKKNGLKASQRFIRKLTDETQNSCEVEDYAQQILETYGDLNNSSNSKRYQFNKLTNREKLFHVIFNRSFEVDPEKLEAAAAIVEPTKAVLYPLWKRVCWIKIPRIGAVVIDNPVTKIAISICTLIRVTLFYETAYQSTRYFLSARALPFFINHTPLKIIHALNTAWGLKDYVYAKLIRPIYNNAVPILLGCLIVHLIVQNLDEDDPIRQISIRATNIIWSLIVIPDDAGDFIFRAALAPALFAWRRCTDLGSYLRSLAQKTEDQVFTDSMEKAYETGIAVLLAKN